MLGSFMTTIAQDPVLREVKLIAEPWDVGRAGTKSASSPQWTEWNGKYRDCMRDFWRGEAGVGELGWRLTGSADLYTSEGRRPYRVDQLHHRPRRLHDARSRRLQRQAQRGQPRGQRDGTNDNRSWNSGAEGLTDDEAVLDLRGRRLRSMLATLILSTGVPMIRPVTSSAAARAATTTPTVRTTDLVDRLGPDRLAARVVDSATVLALRAITAPFGSVLSPVGPEPGDPEDLAWFSPSGAPMTGHGGTTAAPDASGCTCPAS